MAGLARPAPRAERMDEPGLDAGAHERALRGLATLNAWSGGSRRVFRALRALFPGRADLRVLDLASGAGDGAIDLGRRARRAGLDWTVHGLDASPRAVAHARLRAVRRRAPVTFDTADVLHDDLPAGFDVATCSLFLHHLDNARAEALLRRMAACGALVVDDLARGTPGLLLAAAAARVLTRSDVVHDDAPVSVRNAFTRDEARLLAERAGLHGARVEAAWPCRFVLAWRRA